MHTAHSHAHERAVHSLIKATSRLRSSALTLTVPSSGALHRLASKFESPLALYPLYKEKSLLSARCYPISHTLQILRMRYYVVMRLSPAPRVRLAVWSFFFVLHQLPTSRILLKCERLGTYLLTRQPYIICVSPWIHPVM